MSDYFDDSDDDEGDFMDDYELAEIESKHIQQQPQQPQQPHQRELEQEKDNYVTESYELNEPRFLPSIHTLSSDTSLSQQERNSIQWENDQDKKLSELLRCEIPKNLVSYRQGPGSMKLAYLESWQVILLANLIFGEKNWGSKIKERNREMVEEKNGKYHVGCSARVSVWLCQKNPLTKQIDVVTSHEDIGYGEGVSSQSKFKAIESAEKEAVSDARKRALRCFGSAMGNCLYSKEYLKRVKGQKMSEIPSSPLSELIESTGVVGKKRPSSIMASLGQGDAKKKRLSFSPQIESVKNIPRVSSNSKRE